jgi:hypothetical protein
MLYQLSYPADWMGALQYSRAGAAKSSTLQHPHSCTEAWWTFAFEPGDVVRFAGVSAKAAEP